MCVCVCMKGQPGQLALATPHATARPTALSPQPCCTVPGAAVRERGGICVHVVTETVTLHSSVGHKAGAVHGHSAAPSRCAAAGAARSAALGGPACLLPLFLLLLLLLLLLGRGRLLVARPPCRRPWRCRRVLLLHCRRCRLRLQLYGIRRQVRYVALWVQPLQPRVHLVHRRQAPRRQLLQHMLPHAPRGRRPSHVCRAPLPPRRRQCGGAAGGGALRLHGSRRWRGRSAVGMCRGGTAVAVQQKVEQLLAGLIIHKVIDHH